MNKWKKRATSVVLTIVLALQFLPAAPTQAATGTNTNPHPVSGVGVVAEAYNDKIIDQLDHLYSDREFVRQNGNLKEISYVTASMGPRYLDETNSGGAWSTSRFKVDLRTINLAPTITLKSGNGGDWSMTFSPSNLSVLDKADSEAELVIGAIFSHKKQYISYNGKKLTNKQGKQSMSVKIGDVSDIGDAPITVGGGAWGGISGFSVYILDNNAPSIENVTATQENGNLVLEAIVNEELYVTDMDSLATYWNQLYVDVTLQDTRTGAGSETLRLWMKNIGGNKLVYEAALGEWANKDYTILTVKAPALGTLSAEVGIRELEQVYSYDWKDIYGNTRTAYPGCRGYYGGSFKVNVETTVISDGATNPLDITGLNKTVNIKIDNTTPVISAVSVAVPGRTMNTTAAADKDEWPADIDKTSLYLGKGQSATFSVEIDETLTTLEGVQLALNVKDKDGKQVVLELARTGNTQTTYGFLQSILYFKPFTAAEGMTMMEGHEDSVIRPIALTYTKAQDKVGHNLSASTIPKPAEQLYLDVAPPKVTVTKLDTTVNNGYLDLKIDIEDSEAGILGKNAVVTLSSTLGDSINFLYEVNTSMERPSNYTGTGFVDSVNSCRLSYKLQGVESYTYYLHLALPADYQQNVDELGVQVAVSDIMGNQQTTEKQTIEYIYDNIKPVASITGLTVKYDTDSAVVTGTFTAADYNDLAVVQYCWTTGEEQVTDATEWTPAVLENGYATVTKSYAEGQTATDTLWVRAQDEYGNWSDMVSRSIFVTLETPTTDCIAYTDGAVANPDPQVIVTGAAARSDGGAAANTRVTMVMGGNTYVRVVPTGETVNLFDFGGTWYKVAVSGGNYATVEPVSDLTPLQTYYGTVEISFENAYYDLTPVAGSPVVPTGDAVGGSYSADVNKLSVRFAPVQPSGTMHNVTFDKVTSGAGDSLWWNINAAEALKMNLDMTGTQIHFSISNLLQSDWGMQDVDCANSYMVLEEVDAAGNWIRDAVKITGISNSATQFFTIPAVDDAGNNFTTGVYQLKVVILKNGSTAEDVYRSVYIVLDATEAQGAGLWRYRITPESPYIEEELGAVGGKQPIESLGISVAGETQVSRNREFAVYSSGIDMVTLFIGAVENTTSYYGFTLGEVTGVRFWNMASAPTEEQLAGYGFVAPKYDLADAADDGNVAAVGYTYGTKVVEEVPQGALSMDDLYLTMGVNTICCQVQLSNGSISPVGQFQLYVTDETPVMEVSEDSYVGSLHESEVENQINVDSLTVKVDAAYSLNGSGDVRMGLWKKGDVVVNDKLVDVSSELEEHIVSDLKEGDKIILTDDTYSSQLYLTTSSHSGYVRTVFVAMDEYGGVTMVAPQIGEVKRTGSYNTPDYYGVNFYLNEAEYNVPRETYKTWFGEDPGYAFVSYARNNDASVKEILYGTDEDLYVNKYNIESNDISLGEADRTWGHWQDGHEYLREMGWGFHNMHWEELVNTDLVDWETATITVTGEGIDEPVVLPYGTTAPNEAGLIEFSYGDHYVTNEGYQRSLYLVFADPLTDDPADTLDLGKNGKNYQSRTYTINAKDVEGNDVSFTADHTNAFGYSNALLYSGEDLVKYVRYDSNYGVVLYLRPYLENGTNVLYTGRFENGIYETQITDAYGKTWDFTYEITGCEGQYTAEVLYSTIEPTLSPVTVTIDGWGTAVAIEDYNEEIVTITGNGTDKVTVTATENTSFYMNQDGDYNLISIDNIITPEYYLLWSYDEETTPEGSEVIGPVTASLMCYEYDGLELELIDRYTGAAPTVTFYPGEETAYTFKAEDLAYVLGEEQVSPAEDIVVTLPVTLVEAEFSAPGLEEGETIVDNESPEVQLLAYTQQNGVYFDEKLALQVENSTDGRMFDYGGYTIFHQMPQRAQTAEFIESIGWSSAYRFVIETADLSSVKLFIKDGLYVSEVPSYSTGVSDTIPGVSLQGRLLTVTEPASFTLFAVDEMGYCTELPMDIQNVGIAPVPTVAKVPVDEGMRLYLLEPADAEEGQILNLTMLDSGYTIETDEDASGEYYGYSYITVGANGTYTLNYKYDYKFDPDKDSAVVESRMKVKVIEINNAEILLNGQITWSGNRNLAATNQSITAKMNFTQNVASVQVPSEYVDALEVLISGRMVTVRYDDNQPEISMTVLAANGTGTSVALSAVDNIDKTAPQVLGTTQELSENGRYVTVTMYVDENAILRERGSYGVATENGYLYTAVIKENGTYTYCFTDTAGNLTELEVAVNNIIDSGLTMQYSTSADGSGAVADPLALSLNLGDTIYVKLNRACTVDVNGEGDVQALANTWTALTITESMEGLWPIIRAKDQYGNVVLGQLGQVKQPDRTAPIVALKQDVIVVKAGMEQKDLDVLLEENVIASDLDANLTVTLDYTADPGVTGTSRVTYTVTDSSGNAASVTGTLRISALSEPVVSINDEIVYRDTVYVAQHGEALKLTVNTEGEPYSVVYKQGVKTLGQMKNGTTELVRDAEDDTALTLPFTAGDYYTVCIITQSREYYRIQIYVE